MKITMKFDDKLLFIKMMVFSHLMMYETKTVVVSKDAKEIIKRFMIQYSYFLKEHYNIKRDMVWCKDYKHNWWAMIKDVKTPEEIMGICGEKLLFILDNVEPNIIISYPVNDSRLPNRASSAADDGRVLPFF